MLVGAIAQALFVYFLLRWPGWSLVLIAGIAGNLAIVGMWVWTRTVGIPLGASAGEVEKVAPLDVVCTAAELGLIVLLLWMLRKLTGRRRRPSRVR